MSEVVCKRSRIMTIVGELVTSAMPQHVFAGLQDRAAWLPTPLAAAALAFRHTHNDRCLSARRRPAKRERASDNRQIARGSPAATVKG